MTIILTMAGISRFLLIEQEFELDMGHAGDDRRDRAPHPETRGGPGVGPGATCIPGWLSHANRKGSTSPDHSSGRREKVKRDALRGLE